LAEVERRGCDLLEELDPRATEELLEEWERALGLPSKCTGRLETLELRRQALVFRLTALGGQSPAYLVAVAAQLGFEITIEEHFPTTCESECTAPLLGPDWIHVFTVHARPDVSEWATCESLCTAPLRWWNNAVLECAIAEVKPAHTVAHFSYDFAVITPAPLTLQLGILPPTIE
jgi:uncharacterized protein YmfQ (DUF2313 family)